MSCSIIYFFPPYNRLQIQFLLILHDFFLHKSIGLLIYMQNYSGKKTWSLIHRWRDLVSPHAEFFYYHYFVSNFLEGFV